MNQLYVYMYPLFLEPASLAQPSRSSQNIERAWVLDMISPSLLLHVETRSSNQCDYLGFKITIDFIKKKKKAEVLFINFVPEELKCLRSRLRFELRDKSDVHCEWH